MIQAMERKGRSRMLRQSDAKELEIAEIAAVSIAESGVIQVQLLDRDEHEWVIRLPMKVLDACLRRISAERVLEIRAETAEEHARLTYPTQGWELSHDPGSPEPTFSLRTGDGCGLEIGFNIDPISAVPTLAVTVAAN
jgi:hypothetical protein